MKKFLLLILGICSFFGSGFSEITWTAPVTISTALTNATNPQVAIDSSGNINAIWLENGLVRGSVKPAAGSWSAPVTISNVAQTSTSPRLRIDSSGNATAMWIGNAQVQTATKTVGGSWVSAALPVSGSGATSLTFEVDGTGNAVAIWERSGFIESSTRKSGIWSLVAVLSLTASTDPQVAINNSNAAMAVWHTVVGGNDIIVTNNLNITTNLWGTTKNLFSAAATYKHNYPRIALDASGNSIVIWFRYNLSGTNGYSNVSLLASSLPSGSSTWAMATSLSSGGIRNPADLVTRLRYDQNGNAIAVWTNSYDGESFSTESSRLLVGGSWQQYTILQAPTIYSFGMDLAVTSTAALMTNMAWDDSSAITIQSQEADTSNPFNTRWTNNNVFSTGNNNAYPRCALSLNGSNYNAATVWTNYNGANTIINVSTGTGPRVLAPSSVSASQSATSYGVYTDYYNTVTWLPSSDPNLIQYNIYRNGVYFTSTDPSTLQVVDNNQIQGGTVTYGIAAFTSDFNQSQTITFTLFP